MGNKLYQMIIINLLLYLAQINILHTVYDQMCLTILSRNYIKSKVGFRGDIKTIVPRGKPLEQSKEPTNSAHVITCMMPSPGIKPGPHWWKASVLTTVPTLLPLGAVSSLTDCKKLSCR